LQPSMLHCHASSSTQRPAPREASFVQHDAVSRLLLLHSCA
jgi:hypothetical protein